MARRRPETLSHRLAGSPLARVAALPVRLKMVLRYDRKVLADSARWLVRSREHTNYTFELTPLNRVHLAWWVANAVGAPVERIRGYIDEADTDAALRAHVQAATARSDRRRLADPEVHLHRRLGWYALVRELQPECVVETGTDKGLGSVVLAAALLRNGHGRLVTMDINPTAGYLIGGPYAAVTELRVGDSLASLGAMEAPVDFFVHDSWHSRDHELAEYEAVAPRLAEGAVVLSDNSHVMDALPAWAEQTGRRFHYFAEEPQDHWYPGAGIGLAR
jgi:predicted O-methyltransferase YrrM